MPFSPLGVETGKQVPNQMFLDKKKLNSSREKLTFLKGQRRGIKMFAIMFSFVLCYCPVGFIMCH